MTIRNSDQSDRHDSAELKRHDEPPSRAECCQSGCTICVLDYPDAFPARDADGVLTTGLESIPSSPTITTAEIDPQLLEMIEAFERAEAIIATLLKPEPGSVLPNEGDQ